MATATIQGITFSDLTPADMLALVNMTVEKVAPVKVEVPCEKVEKVIEKVQRATGDMHALACGHSVPVSRGRYPSACADCKNGNSDNSELVAELKAIQAEAPKPKRDPEAWLTKPASQKQIGRIQRKLTDERVSKSMANRLDAEVAAGVNGGRAREINNALNAVLGIEIAA